MPALSRLHYNLLALILKILFISQCVSASAGEFETFIKPLLVQKCQKCHGGEEINGEMNFKEVSSHETFLAKPNMIKEMIEAIDSNNMPPEDEPQFDEDTRNKLLETLKTTLQESVNKQVAHQAPLRRLNRFQYNNTVRDLFQLNRDVFPLSEKLMTRHNNYLHQHAEKMPNQINVSSQSLNPVPGFKDVRPFPKDLRAEHGFDNQVNQLTLSPLLLDAFLRLSVSIVEIGTFHEQTVGIWKDFFQTPAEKDLATEVRTRLAPFLLKAFRRPANQETLTRYTNFVLSKLDAGLAFEDAMKKAASAVMSSPMFLYRSSTLDPDEKQFELASRLSYFLWGSCPDLELLQLAKEKKLSNPETLKVTIDRMMADPKIERFLDSFPSQWMQLENLMAVTPDPQINKYFTLDNNHPASLQMVLEPLLLFDAIFVEDRPVIELVNPTFSYQSEFLQTWYTSDLTPPPVDLQTIENINRENEAQRTTQQMILTETRLKLEALLQTVSTNLLTAKKEAFGKTAPVDLKPYAAWEFNGDLNDSINGLHLKPHGKIEYQDGSVVLNKTYLQSQPLPIDLQAKTMEVWFKLPKLKQHGGGLMGIHGPGDFFDTIVLGERKPKHWISGSNGFQRTEDFPESYEETKLNEFIQLVMVYAKDGTTILYRDGKPYGKPYRKKLATFPKDQSVVLFGLRHLPPGGDKFLQVTVDKARLYDRALTPDEVGTSSNSLYVSEREVLAALTPEQKQERDTLTIQLKQSENALKRIPVHQDLKGFTQKVQRKFEEQLRRQLRGQDFRRVITTDPRYGGIITNAAILSMTSGPKRTHPIARGAWMIEVIFNDPPPPPPNDVPPLKEKDDKNLTVRERFAAHRANPSCAGCHSKLDPLGFALENYDITGRWRDKYPNGREVDSSGKLLRKYDFESPMSFKTALVKEEQRVVRGFIGHLLRFALARELHPSDFLEIDSILTKAANCDFRMKTLIQEIILSESFLQE